MNNQKEKKSAVAKIIIFVFIAALIIVGICIYVFLKDAIVISDNGEIPTIEDGLNEEEIEEFNNIFLKYTDKDLTKVEVEELLDLVSSSNAINANNKIKVVSKTNEEESEVSNLEEYKEMLLEDNTYEMLIIEQDTDDIITSIKIIGEILEIDQEQLAFNNQFTKYQGSEITGDTLNQLVDLIVALNSDEENKYKIDVSIIAKDMDALDIASEDLLDRSLIGTAPEDKFYEVTTSKDIALGYVNLITIEDLGDEVDRFNREYEKYDEQNILGTQVNDVLDKLVQNNLTNQELKIGIKTVSIENKVIEISGENATNVSTIGRALDESVYELRVHKEETTGYINLLEIREITRNETEDLSENTFNKKFQEYQGDLVKGDRVNELVDLVIYNNLNDNEERKIKITIYTLSGTVIKISKDEAISKEVIGVAPSDKKYNVVAKVSAYTNNVEEIEIYEAE